jgi:hypothetical protein
VGFLYIIRKKLVVFSGAHKKIQKKKKENGAKGVEDFW